MTAVKARRTYAEVTLQEAGGGLQLVLDGKPARTPAGNLLMAPTRPLAEAVREEFAAQGDKPNPASMPLTSLLCTAIDRTGPQYEAVLEAILAYGETDMLCYRDPDQPELAALQQQEWGAVLDWARAALGVSFCAANGVMPVGQSADTVECLRRELSSCGAEKLTAIGVLVQATGSLVLALALAKRNIPASQAVHLALLEEEFQAQRWGRDELAEERRVGIAHEIEIGEKFLNLLGK